jgi:predicted Rdx family selenoprotein
VDKVCGCGNEAVSPLQELSCRKCGAPCCPSCAFALDSATYCVQCAESILDAEGVPLSLSAPAAWIWPRSARAGFPDGRVLGEKVQWIILVAKDQSDLFAHLVRAFARDDKVVIVMDRRKDYSRNPPGMEDRLRIHGAAVIKRRRL